MTKNESSSHTKSNTPAIVGGVIGGVAAIVSVIGTTFFVRRRRRQHRSAFSDLMEDVSIPSGAALTSGTWAGQQPLLSEGPEAEMTTLHSLSSTPPAISPYSGPVAPVPVGLSAKDLARLRTEALNLGQSHNNATSNVPQSTSSLNVVDESGGATSSYDPRRLQSEVESLWREMERLRTSGPATGAPPSYTEGEG